MYYSYASLLRRENIELACNDEALKDAYCTDITWLLVFSAKQTKC